MPATLSFRYWFVGFHMFHLMVAASHVFAIPIAVSSPLLFSSSSRKNDIEIPYTESESRIRNEHFVYEINGRRRNFVSEMSPKSFVSEFS